MSASGAAPETPPAGRSGRVDLSRTPAFRLAGVEVRPASREVVGPLGAVVAEPRVLQVLIVLAEAGGATVSRDLLVQRCWEGRAVGDDAIQRAVAKARRLADLDDPPAFAVESIARIGYRLRAAPPDTAEAAEAASAASTSSPALRPTSRRLWLAGAAAAGVTAVGGGAAWVLRRGVLAPPAPDAERELMERGRAAFDRGLRADNAEAVALFRQAAHLAPRDAAAWGALALALRFEQAFVPRAARDETTRAADAAAARALALDGRQRDGIAARSLYVPFDRHWLETERRLRQGLREAPGHGVLNGFLGKVLATVGRVREGAAALEAALVGERFVPILRGDLALALWADERTPDADRVLDEAVALWPRYPGLWWIRLWLYAGTGREEAARAHLGRAALVPAEVRPEALTAAAAAVEAFATRRTEAVDAALAAAASASASGALPLRDAAGLAASLGRLDLAFDLAERELAPGPGGGGAPGQPGFLFGALAAPLRRDPRFASLVREAGLDAYWRASGSRPDYAR